jgi:hypothetical protein
LQQPYVFRGFVAAGDAFAFTFAFTFACVLSFIVFFRGAGRAFFAPLDGQGRLVGGGLGTIPPWARRTPHRRAS